ncbi:MAG TPA: glycosyltransferase [Vicinamibacterales bacterium]|nr:glycosyltransferase [Vicinamibacterales bacterium]
MRSRAMRVCHVMSADLWAGAEVQVATLTSYLARSSEVTLSVVLFNDGSLAAELRRIGIDVTVVDERNHGAVDIVKALTTHFRVRQTDIVHTHRYKDNILATAAALVAGGPRIIRTVHGLTEPMRGWARLKCLALETVDWFALGHCAAAVVAVSRDTAAAMMAKGFSQQFVRQIHNGIDMVNTRATRCRDEVRREFRIAADSPLVGTAGRLTPVKAQDDFLRAAHLIARRQPDFRFVIVGEGPEESALRQLAADLGIEGQVIFTGGRRDVNDLIAAMDVFVLPSLAEGMPMVLLEAMTLGTPCVATAVGGVPELIEHHVNGVLVPPRAPRALAEACTTLASNRSWARSLAARATQTIAENFSQPANGSKVVQTYREVAATALPDQAPVQRVETGLFGLSRTLVVALAAYIIRRARRMVSTGAARWRVRRLRHDPSPLMEALRSAQRILIVCQGNIIRSPFAARLVQQALHSHGRISVVSAGLSAVAGRPPHPAAEHIATTHSVDLSGHAASPIDAEAVRASDVIFVMDIAQLVAMHDRYPEARTRTFLLTSLAADAPLEIADPVDGDEVRFQVCFDHISTAVRPIVHTLCGSPVLQ